MKSTNSTAGKVRFLSRVQPNANGAASVPESLLASLLAGARPALAVERGEVQAPPDSPWADAMVLHQQVLRTACAGIGRLDAPSELSESVGTAFLVAPDMVMTTRVAAESFAIGIGLRNLVFRPGRTASVEFGEGQVCRVKAIVMIHPVLDVALLRIDPPAGCEPLRLSTKDPGTLQERLIAVIGFPQRDARYDEDLQRVLLGDTPGAKRVMPGRVLAPQFFPMLGRSSLVLVHDAVPLGGSSGAPVVDLETGVVLGVQFASRNLEGNYAVPASELARDTKLGGLLQFEAAPQPLPLLWDDEWRFADEETTPESPELALLSSTQSATTPAPLLDAVQRAVRERFKGNSEFRSFLSELGHEDVVQAVPERADMRELVRALNRRGAVDAGLLHALNPSLAQLEKAPMLALETLTLPFGDVRQSTFGQAEVLMDLPGFLEPDLQWAGFEAPELKLASASAAPAAESAPLQGPTWPVASLRKLLQCARAVGLLRLPQGSGSTGWLLTPDLFVVPAHVLPAHVAAPGAPFDSAFAAEAFVEFQTEDGSARREAFAVQSVAWLDATLDLALLRLALPLEDRQPLVLRTDPLPMDTRLTALHHPLLAAQQVSVGGHLLAHDAQEVRYSLDTAPGSAGAPVFDPEWQVIATHRASTASTTNAEPALAPKIGTATGALVSRLRQYEAGGRKLWSEVVAAHPELRSIDPTLRSRLAQIPEDEMVPVLVRLVQPGAALGDVPGFRTHSTAYGVLTGVGRPDAILALLRHPGVESVEPSLPTAAPECALSVPHIGAPHIHAAPHGELGAQALVAVIDTGVDVLHEAFRGAAGHTRIVAYWDQHDQRAPAGTSERAVGHSADAQQLVDLLKVPYGALYVAADIDRFIAGAALPAGFPAGGAISHGTLVSSIAAGRPCGAADEQFSGGVAPEAALAVIRYDLQDASVGYSKGHVDALSFIDGVASYLGLPVVVNISNGMNAGAHDGTSPVERTCDQFTGNGARPGRVVVKSAGNERQAGRHAGFVVNQGRTKLLRWRSQPRPQVAPLNRAERIELWFDTSYQYRFSLKAPGGAETPVVDPTHKDLEEYLANGNLVQMMLRPYTQDNADGSLVIMVSPGRAAAIENGEWALTIHGLRVPAPVQKIHAWVEWMPDRDVHFPDYAEDQVTVTIPGTANHVISVGAVAVGKEMITYDHSSWGPTRKGVETPDLVAPGVGLYAAGAARGALRSPVAESGTSLAAPHVTGAIALALSACVKSGRPPHTSMRVRAALKNTTRHRSAWSPETGWGELDAQAFYEDLLH